MKKLLGNRLAGNIISLIALQGSNYLFPLITFPYLVRTLGIEKYGVLLFCVSIMQFLNIFIDYGFNISGTRDISINKDRKEKINAIYNVILTIKMTLTVLFGVIYFSIIILVPYFGENRAAFLLSFLMIIGNTLFPLWLYQGLERMKYITYFNVAAKSFVTMLIFIFVKNPDDLNLAVFFQTLYFVLPAIISILFVKMKLKLKFKIVGDLHQIKAELKRGKHVFLTTLWVNFYSQGPIVILGFIAGSHATGNYGIGEKVQGAFYGISQPFTQALYPYLCHLFENKKEQFYVFKQKLVSIGMISAVFIAISLFIFSAPLAGIVTGTADPMITSMIRIFTVIVFLSITNTLMARIMHAVNLSNVLNKSYSIAAIGFIVFSIPLTMQLHEFGMAAAVIIAEGTVFALNIRNVIGIKAADKLQSQPQNGQVAGS